MIPKKLSSILMVSAIFFGASLAQADDHKAKLTLHIATSSPVYDEEYTLSVPADTAINAWGWNSLGNITAKYSGTNAGFNGSKKLVVTTKSANNASSQSTSSASHDVFPARGTRAT